MKRLASLLFICLSCLVYSAESQVKDSLSGIWLNTSLKAEDRLNALNRLIYNYCLYSNPDSAYKLIEEEYRLAVNSGLRDFEAKAFNNLGFYYELKGDFEKSIDHFQKGLEIWTEIDDKNGMASAYNNLSGPYRQLGNYVLHSECLTKSLLLFEETGNESGIANVTNNLGVFYLSQEDLSESLKYFKKALKLHKKIGSKHNIPNSLGNIGLVYNHQGQIDKSLEYFLESYGYYEESNDILGKAIVLYNIGECHFANKDYDLALDSYYKSLAYSDTIEDLIGKSASQKAIAKVYFEQGLFQKAIHFAEKALVVGQEINSLEEVKEAALVLYQSYKSVKDHKMALEMYEMYVANKDSLNGEGNQKEIIHQKYRYEYEKKKALEDAARNAEIKQQEILAVERKKQQFVITISISLGLILTLSFLLVIFRRLKITRTQKNEISLQKDTIETILEDVTDSINYAKHLQDAILPNDDEIRKRFPESFIIYNPKDAVSGDFYWFEMLHSTSYLENTTYLAVADCTGHGVPGAMVSVVCSNALNRTIFEYDIKEPSKILDKARELIVSMFENEGTSLNDGMDIVLCSFRLNELIYSGANNPLWIIRETRFLTEEQKESSNILIDGKYTLIELKSDRQPVGNYVNMKPFTEKRISIRKGDCLYLFTDGYVDQFGGEKGKKYMRRRFKKMLLGIQSEPMEKQYTLIKDSFNNWKGIHDQIDDVCVMGLKIT